MSHIEAEVEWLRRIAESRDASALEQLYDRYEKPIYAFAYRILQDAMAAEEAVQELFSRVWNKPDRYDPSQGKLSTWLFALTRNIAVDMLRRRGSRLPSMTVEQRTLTEVPDETADTAEQVHRKLIGEHIRDALRELNPDQRQAIEYIYFQGLSQQEMAERFDIPLGTIKSRVRLALKQLRRRFAGWNEEGRRVGDEITSGL
jgi:RNA polymerase sigma-70 factor (ECF subfamily)